MKWITVFGCCPRGSTWINSNHLLSERLWQWFSDLTGVKLKFNSAIYIIIVIHPSIHIDDKNEDGDDDYSPAHVIKATLITRLQRWIPSTSPPDPHQISYPSLARHLNWLLWSWSLCLCVSAFHFAFGSHKIVRFVHLSYFRKDSFEISMPPPPPQNRSPLVFRQVCQRVSSCEFPNQLYETRENLSFRFYLYSARG